MYLPIIVGTYMRLSGIGTLVPILFGDGNISAIPIYRSIALFPLISKPDYQTDVLTF